jgi:hypothetical protein
MVGFDMFMTAAELYAFLRKNVGPRPPENMAEPDSWGEFVSRYVGSDSHYISRGDNGEIRAAAFGWPIFAVDIDGGYDGSYVERDGRDGIFYVRFMATSELETGEMRQAMAAIDERICERHPRTHQYIFHRAKHGDRTSTINGRRIHHG